MKKVNKIILFLLIICVSLPYTASAAEKTAAQRKKEMADKIAQADKDYENAMDKKLYYDKLADELQSDIDYLDGLITSLNSDIDEKNEQIEEYSRQLEIKQDNFEKRLRALQHRGAMSYLDVIFGAENFSDFLVRVTLVGDLVDHDKNMINEVAAIKSSIIDAKAELESKKSEQQNAKDSIAQQQSQYEVLANKQQSAMTELASDKEKYKAEYQKAVKEMEEESRKAAAAVASTVTYSGGTGKFAWPLAGRGTITCRYGYRTDPAPSNHTGIDIAISTSTPIYAADSGTVTKAVNGSTGYGKYVIINHGDGSSTLYAHASKLYVQVGQKVARGETIAAVGSTGWSTGPHLHFEVILNGKKVNPEPYIK